MYNEKLVQIGSKLNVSAQEIKGVQRGYFVSKMKYYIATGIVGILTFVLGFFAGRGTCPETDIGLGGGYPYAAGLFVPAAMSGKKNLSKIVVTLISVIGFVTVVKAASVFGQAIEYGVYKKA